MHFSFSSWMQVCISCTPSLPNQFFIAETFPSQKVYILCFLGIFDTSISKFMRSMYMSCLPQLDAGFTSTGPLCLCLCGSLWLTVMLSWNLASASLSAIITTISACTVVLVICVCDYLEWLCLPDWNFYSWHHEMLLALNVMTLRYLIYYYILSAYIHVSTKYE